jgi:hypothetical protein
VAWCLSGEKKLKVTRILKLNAKPDGFIGL